MRRNRSSIAFLSPDLASSASAPRSSVGLVLSLICAFAVDRPPARDTPVLHNALYGGPDQTRPLRCAPTPGLGWFRHSMAGSRRAAGRGSGDQGARGQLGARRLGPAPVPRGGPVPAPRRV